MKELLQSSDLETLEKLFEQEREVELPPAASYKGSYLKRLQNKGANKPWFSIPQALLFEFTPFGINFAKETGDWFFLNPAFQLGRFSMKIGPSRWRNTTVVQLHYEV